MRLLIIVISLLLCVGIEGQPRIGIQVGYSYSTFSSTDASPSAFYTYSTSGISGFQVGTVAEVRLAPKWILRPGLFITSKGTSLKRVSSSDTNWRHIELQYLEMPVSLLHQWVVGKNNIAFTGGGLYAARAFRGVEIGRGNSAFSNYSIENYVEFKSNNNNVSHPTIIKPWDYGYTFVAGFEKRRVQLLLSYTQGIERVLPKAIFYNGKYTNRVLSISSSYLINAKRR